MHDIQLILNQLLVTQPASAVDLMFMGTLLGKLKTAKGSTEDKCSDWKAEVTIWHHEYKKNTPSVLWHDLKMNVEKEAQAFKDDWTDNNTGCEATQQVQPRLAPQTPQGFTLYTSQDMV
eukprot:3347456-Rhodomonas_salina.1